MKKLTLIKLFACSLLFSANGVLAQNNISINHPSSVGITDGSVKMTVAPQERMIADWNGLIKKIEGLPYVSEVRGAEDFGTISISGQDLAKRTSVLKSMASEHGFEVTELK